MSNDDRRNLAGAYGNKFFVMDTVRHLPDRNWWPFSSVNRICKVLRVYNGNCYEIVPIDGKSDPEIVYVCSERELEAVE